MEPPGNGRPSSPCTDNEAGHVGNFVAARKNLDPDNPWEEVYSKFTILKHLRRILSVVAKLACKWLKYDSESCAGQQTRN